MKFMQAGDLGVRFYDGGFALLTRRDGRRTLVAHGAARALRQLLERVGLDGLVLLRGQRFDTGPEAHVLGFVDQVLARLDAAPVPTSLLALLRRAPDFYEQAQRRRIPLLAMLELTYRCNLRCRHCYVLDRVECPTPAQATRADLERLLRELARAGCLDVSLTGGETTLHADYLALVALAKDLHLETTLKTNASTFTPRRAAAYAADPAHETQASLYGATPEVHDAFTGIPGSFARSVRGLRCLAEAGVRCLVSCIVWRDNAREIDALESLVQPLGHTLALSDVIHGRLNGDRAPLALRIAPQERAGLLAAGRLQPFAPEACIAGTVKVKVEPDGGLSPCELVPGRGNVFAESFEGVWRDASVCGWSDELLRWSISEQRDGRPVRTCPAMNQLNTGRPTGLTSIA